MPRHLHAWWKTFTYQLSRVLILPIKIALKKFMLGLQVIALKSIGRTITLTLPWGVDKFYTTHKILPIEVRLDLPVTHARCQPCGFDTCVIDFEMPRYQLWTNSVTLVPFDRNTSGSHHSTVQNNTIRYKHGSVTSHRSKSVQVLISLKAHYNDVIMSAMGCQISRLSRLFTQPFVQVQIK